VWGQYDGTVYNVVANRYVSGYGWIYPEVIDIELDSAGSPKVSIDDSGNAMAVWAQPYDDVRACRYDSDTGWEMPVLLDTEDEMILSINVDMNSDGDAVAVWTQDDGVARSVWAKAYVSGDGWGATEIIDSTDYVANSAQVAMDDTGNATAVWHDMEISTHIWANTYNPDSGWGTAHLVEEDETHSALYPTVAMDGSGNAMAVWHQYGTPQSDIWANRYVAGVGWGTPELIEHMDAGNAQRPVVAFDAAGNAAAVWSQADGVTVNATSNRYVAGVGWGEAVFIEADDTGIAQSLGVATGGDGVAFAVWTQFDGDRYNTWANRYLPGFGWEDASPIEMAVGNCEMASIGVGGAGDAIAVWVQEDSEGKSVYANRYVVEDNTPPVITVTSPACGTETNVTPVAVIGETEPGAELSVNGMKVYVDDVTGAFETFAPLSEGENDIVITAVDSWGNSATVTVTVTYDDPAAEIIDQLEELRSEFNSTLEELDDVTERLDNSLGEDGGDAKDTPSTAVVFGAIAAVAIGLLAVMFLMYASLRSSMKRSEEPQRESYAPPPPE
jgi:hypothetical protein